MSDTVVLDVTRTASCTAKEVVLSVVIVNWNTREVLRACLGSVFAELDTRTAEVFVVDNGSTDGSCKMVCEHFPEVRLIANAQNLGFAAANNQAIRRSSGRYILLLNSDTVVLKDVLTRSVAYMERSEGVGVMGCRVLNTDGSVQMTCSRFPSLLNLILLSSGVFRVSGPRFFGRYQIRDWQRDTEREVDTVTGCYMLVRRAALKNVGLLDESFFFYGEETDWCKRFLKAGWQLRFAPVGEIIHHGSLSSRQCNHRRDVMLTEGLLRFHRKHGGRFAACLAWGILAAFCISRYVFWKIQATITSDASAKNRRDHFWNVLRSFGSVWPRDVEVAQ